VTSRLPYLDALRAAAAFGVLVSHLRSFLFVDWSFVTNKNILLGIFYFLTGLGHEAVIVFFVLSGFFVGGSVAKSWERGSWSASRYALQRLVRLETVLIPALLFTLFWDAAGNLLSEGAGYDGRWAMVLRSGPSPETIGVSHDATSLLGNVFFLMGIFVPTYGSNGPLWSLANEFWYYVIFPCVWIALLGKGISRLLASVVASILLWELPTPISLYGLVWLQGFCAWTLYRRKLAPAWFLSRSSACLLMIAFVACLYISKRSPGLSFDLLLGLSAALLTTFLSGRQTVDQNQFTPRLLARMADVSYSLYLFHFPFLCFIFFSFVLPHRFQPEVTSFALFVGIGIVTLAYAYAAWWCFEKNTDAVRSIVSMSLVRGSRVPK
jgi:peptidoglycan/LPS O-acetylase OafA/YrhL